MADYGIKISAPNYDVNSAGDVNTIVNTKYAFLKGADTGTGTTPDIPHDTTITVTIPHGLSYIPFARVLLDPFGTGEYYNSPFFETTLTSQTDVWSYCDDTNLYIKVYQGNDFSSTLPGIDYVYYIFIDKGNLH